MITEQLYINFTQLSHAEILKGLMKQVTNIRAQNTSVGLREVNVFSETNCLLASLVELTVSAVETYIFVIKVTELYMQMIGNQAFWLWLKELQMLWEQVNDKLSFLTLNTNIKHKLVFDAEPYALKGF